MAFTRRSDEPSTRRVRCWFSISSTLRFVAAASYLTWHSRSEVLKFASSLSRDVQVLSDYLDGDSTIAVGKDEVH